MGRVVVIEYGAQILSFEAFKEMQTPSVADENIDFSIDTSKINWRELARKVAEEINNVRLKPKNLTRQMERSLKCFGKPKVLKVPGRETRFMDEGASAYIEALEFCDSQRA